jgi:hypothetical protein
VGICCGLGRSGVAQARACVCVLAGVCMCAPRAGRVRAHIATRHGHGETGRVWARRQGRARSSVRGSSVLGPRRRRRDIARERGQPWRSKAWPGCAAVG